MARRNKVNLLNLVHKFETEGLSHKELMTLFSNLVRQDKLKETDDYYREVATNLVGKGYLTASGSVTLKGIKFYIDKDNHNKWQVKRNLEMESILRKEVLCQS